MRYIRFGQCQFNRTNLRQSFLAEKKHLAENEQLAETYICFYTFRPVAESNIFFFTFRPVAESNKTRLYVSANYFLAETYHIRSFRLK
jgi:hypothetical protein